MVFSALRFNSTSMPFDAVPPQLCSGHCPCCVKPCSSSAMRFRCNTLRFHCMAHLRPCRAATRSSVPLHGLTFLSHIGAVHFRCVSEQFLSLALPLLAGPLLNRSMLYLCCSLRSFAFSLHFLAMPFPFSALPLLRYAEAGRLFSLPMLFSDSPLPSADVQFRSFSQQRPSCFRRGGASHSSGGWNSSFHWQCLNAMCAA